MSITLLDGTKISSTQPDVHEQLSRELGRHVRLERTSSRNYVRETDRTPLNADATEPTILDEPIALVAPHGTFFDVAPLHLLSLETLSRLQALYPRGQWDVRRFRPNIVVAARDSLHTFPEQGWLGHLLTVGNNVLLRAIDPAPHCVVTALPQSDLAADFGILRTLAEHTNSMTTTLVPDAVFRAVAGIYAQVEQSGTIVYGDSAHME